MTVVDFLPALAQRLAAQCRNLAGAPLRPDTQQLLVDYVVNPTAGGWGLAERVLVRPGVSVGFAARHVRVSEDGVPDPHALLVAVGQALAENTGPTAPPRV